MRLAKFLLALVIMTIAACGMFRTPIPAASCFIVEADSGPEQERRFDHGRQLGPLLDRFALETGLVRSYRETPQDSSPYSDVEKGIRVSLMLGVGVRRAAVVLYVAPEAVCVLCDDFESFMLNEVAQNFTVIHCDDEEGFSSPVLYGADLHR